MYNSVYFEISGLCNAKCPWCVNGRGRLKPYPSRFIPPHEFHSAINCLFEKSLINSKSLINLYNFGEPLLHPSLNEILQILVENRLKYTISTNASKFLVLNASVVDNLHLLLISMPGFSQKSYDKIHGFNFEEILVNIDRWIQLIGPEKIQILFHVYQFNRDEIELAAAYFKQKKIRFLPYFAYFNDYDLALSYLNNTLPHETLIKASKELFLDNIEQFISQHFDHYTCPQISILTIDEYCNVLTCCLISKADPNYSIGSLFSLSKKEIENKKISQEICKECLKKGIAQWVNTPNRPLYLQKFDN